MRPGTTPGTVALSRSRARALGAMCERVSGVRSDGLPMGQNNALWPPENPQARSPRLARLRHAPAEQHAAKTRLSITAIKSRSICTGIRREACRISPRRRTAISAPKTIPSWRRICKVLLNNDYWCRALSFSPNKPKHYQRYSERGEGEAQGVGHFMRQRIITEIETYLQSLCEDRITAINASAAIHKNGHAPWKQQV